MSQTEPRRPYNEGLEEAAYIARTKPHLDDGERPVRQHASPASDREIKLAFAVMQEMIERIDEFAPGYCDAHSDWPRLSGGLVRR
jgi:hypothetical protein